MGFFDATKTCLIKYKIFSGRATRSEFWWFVLFLAILSSIIETAVSSSDGKISVRFGLEYEIGPHVSVARNLFSVFTFVPLIAALTRRLHDLGKPGYTGLIAFGVVFGFIMLILVALNFSLPTAVPIILGILTACFVIYCMYILCKASQPGPNTYGPNPNEVPT